MDGCGTKWLGLAGCCLLALLGPEATRVRITETREFSYLVRETGLEDPDGWLFLVVFENCRVDASIFVVKLLRAHGGCLGFRSR